MTVYHHDRHEHQLIKYGLNQGQWQLLLKAMPVCPACRKPWSSTRLPCVDHRHADGLVRGLLCTSDNYDIGTHHDNAEWFARVAGYLAQPPAVTVLGEVWVPGSIGEHRAH